MVSFYRKSVFLMTAALWLASCGDSITPKISAKFDARREGGRISLSVTVTNETDRPTVPLVVTADIAGKPVIHPAAFALNRHEAHTVTGSVDTNAAATARLTIKEAERGRVLLTEKREIAGL